MDRRWKMNRIGFVNFWLYDEEIFDFQDGKLLFRGQNGSGKSISTQSIIPFILDGDRTPSRLDPFGSSDRRMEYYFLGEEGRDEATGYLFLEFKRRGTEEYRTLCIGQRAKKGKPMDFWGFVLMDGRRIGFDIFLYREVGSSRIPYDKREMRQLVGEKNPFTDAPGEYKKLVNQYVFGFRKMEDYEQFIRLLVKVRSPKLSKEFKPTKVYEILNDSLQTLTDEELRPMVDAMEKMDEIQASLERLERAFSDVKIIRTEYIRYNQFMLARKGQAFLRKRGELEKTESELSELKTQKEELTERRRASEEGLRRNAGRIRLCEAEQDSLMDSDLEEMDRRLEEARRARADALEGEDRWSEKAVAYRDRLRIREETIRELKNKMELLHSQICKRRQILEEYQESIQWEGHPKVLSALDAGNPDEGERLAVKLREFRKVVGNCLAALREYGEAVRRHDEAAEVLDRTRKQEGLLRLEWEAARQALRDSTEQWVTELFSLAGASGEWHPERGVLLQASEEAGKCDSLEDLGVHISAVEKLLRDDYERQRGLLADEANAVRHRAGLAREELQKAGQELEEVRGRKELEPPRDPAAERTRQILGEKGIVAVPFYRAVEFAPGLEEAACARLEAQLEKAGLLDALVLPEEGLVRIGRECPEFLDTVLVPGSGGEAMFPGLVPGEDLPGGVRDMTERILRSLSLPDCGEEGLPGKAGDGTKTRGHALPGAAGAPGEQAGDGPSGKRSAPGASLALRADGYFRHGLLAGRADKEDAAEYVGRLARERKREQAIALLLRRTEELRLQAEALERDEGTLVQRMSVLEAEYRGCPDFSAIRKGLEDEHKLSLDLERAEQIRREAERREEGCAEQKNVHFQRILKLTKPFPYGRTEEAYQEVLDASGEYQEELDGCGRELGKLAFCRQRLGTEEEELERDSQLVDDALYEKRRMETRIQEAEVRIRSLEEYLARPEIVEKARRLGGVKQELETLGREAVKLRDELSRASERLEGLSEREPGMEAACARLVREELLLRRYFEEELALGLVADTDRADPVLSAQEAMKKLREGDRSREATEVLNALTSVYQRYNGSLVNYGTSIEECFGDPLPGVDMAAWGAPAGEGGAGDAPAGMPGGEDSLPGALRKRVRVVSVWNGKKVYLEEFYGILRDSIAETEQLIRRKDRELFEDILSQTISRQLTDRIDASRRWVKDMSSLMQNMDTSMGLRFSLDWKPCRADNEAEIDTVELEQILLRNRELLTAEDIERVASHFRSKVRKEKLKSEEEGSLVNYMEMVRDALDYRRWFEFRMSFQKGDEAKKPLTNSAFNRLSGGEKAMAMYVPLFAAVNAQYRKAGDAAHPRMVALDEAFAGVDDRNIGIMFELVEQMDFDYIMNSQALWGCYESVSGLRIAELLRPANSPIVTVIRYTWNGRERTLDEQ